MLNRQATEAAARPVESKYADLTIVGEGKAKAVAALLIQRSAWFAMMPLPDDQWRFKVKAGEGHGEAIGLLQKRSDERAHGQHSPAPFRHETDGVGGYNIIDADGRLIGCTSGEFGDEVPVAEEDANARLFVASPDLLEACKAMRDAYARAGGPSGSVQWEDLDHAHRLALAALAKTRGGA